MADKKKETDVKKVRELVEMMKENDLVEIEIVDGENKILLKRPQPTQPVVNQVPMPAAPAAPQAPAPQAAAPAPAQAEAAPAQDEGLDEIIAPMVGTFYTAPSPDSDPYVKVGSKVDPDTVVCIVEAMKVMNEIKAETTGTIVEVLRKAGEAVEYGQPLFKVKPD
ncbi:Biotin carboxyl carrier protein of acetyl-CoA carboxylase [Anaerohalosphaera lusitana]|uniref:Biotin carboxyl carrier protein of acetyl-CoA carboxylase n=1 Tax=Anaerohalosphaera lusitana TaxID=1936003 RepID=A0A1U9NHX5_9BACT|nr:acetyl-CoA carboxylase biotin carboxyl carrier protein [Anaerohalosphaera lusitana]AQT67533.1 Biotin carboxyl carrier protein of acetyl-CoA carboxylase [Anaerohalosphaera lusitana]